MVARSLAKEIVILLQEEVEKKQDSSKAELIAWQEDVLKIVECASLVHDLETLHTDTFGEDIIRQWFKKTCQASWKKRSDVAAENFYDPYVYDFYRLKEMRNRFVLHRCMISKVNFDGLDLTAATLNDSKIYVSIFLLRKQKRLLLKK